MWKVFFSRPTSALLVLAAIIPLVLFAVVTTVASLRQQEEASKNTALEATKRISAIADAELRHQLSLVQSLAAHPDLDEPSDFNRFEESARRLSAVEPLLLAVLLAALNRPGIRGGRLV